MAGHRDDERRRRSLAAGRIPAPGAHSEPGARGSWQLRLFLLRYWHSLASAGITGAGERSRICQEAEEHLLQVARDLESAGWTAAEARREAVRRFGPPEALVRSWARLSARVAVRLRLSALVLAGLVGVLGLVLAAQARDPLGLALALLCGSAAGAIVLWVVGRPRPVPASSAEPEKWPSAGSRSGSPVAPGRHDHLLVPDLHQREAFQSCVARYLPSASSELVARISGFRKRAGDAAVVQALLAEVPRNLPGHPARACTLATLARSVLECGTLPRSLSNLYAHTLAAQANALRAQGRLREAEEPLELAGDVARCGRRVGQSTRTAVTYARGGVARSLGRVDEAESLLIHTLSRSSALGYQEAAWNCLNRLVFLYRSAGELDRSIDVSLQAEGLARHIESPLFLLTSREQLVLCLADQGRVDAAARHQAEVREHFGRFPDPYFVAILNFTDGTLDRLTGDPGSAEARWVAARRWQSERGNSYQAANMGVELASLYLAQGRWIEARRVASEVLPVFEALGALPQAARARALLDAATGSTP